MSSGLWISELNFIFAEWKDKTYLRYPEDMMIEEKKNVRKKMEVLYQCSVGITPHSFRMSLSCRTHQNRVDKNVNGSKSG